MTFAELRTHFEQREWLTSFLCAACVALQPKLTSLDSRARSCVAALAATALKQAPKHMKASCQSSPAQSKQ